MTVETLRAYLKPKPITERFEFLPSKEAVPLGHRFEHNGETWEVTWCQEDRIGWLIMIAPV